MVSPCVNSVGQRQCLFSEIAVTGSTQNFLSSGGFSSLEAGSRAACAVEGSVTEQCHVQLCSIARGWLGSGLTRLWLPVPSSLSLS